MRDPWEPSSLIGTECGSIGSIIIEVERVWIHVSHHHLGGTECGSMGAIIIEGIQSVWGSDGVAISDWRRRGEHACSNHCIYDKTKRSD